MDAHCDGDCCPTCRQLFKHLQVDLEGLAAAAVFLRVGKAQEAGLAEYPKGAFGIALLRLVLEAIGASSASAICLVSESSSSASALGRSRSTVNGSLLELPSGVNEDLAVEIATHQGVEPGR